MALYEKIFNKLKPKLQVEVEAKSVEIGKGFRKLAFVGGAASHASDIDHTEIKRTQLDHAFQKLMDDIDERDYIGDEEMELLCDHFDPNYSKKNKFENVISFENFKDGIEAEFEAPKTLKRKSIIFKSSGSNSHHINRMLHQIALQVEKRLMQRNNRVRRTKNHHPLMQHVS